MGAFRSFRFFMFGIPVFGKAVDREKKTEVRREV